MLCLSRTISSLRPLMSRAYTSKVTIVDASTFDTTLTSSKVPVLVDFFATWCAPCRALSPVLDKIADSNDTTLKVIKIDIDNATKIAQSHNVASLPTVILFKDGLELGRFVGVKNEGQLQSFINEHKA